MIFSHYQLRPLLQENKHQTLELSGDLGLTSLPIQKTAQGWRLPDEKILTKSQIERVCQNENGCFRLIGNQLHKIETFSERTNRYYSLMPTQRAPTLLISGIPMHRIKNTDPIEDTRQKIKVLGKAYGLILDTATGLGYTAIEASKQADHVITIELDPAVLKIARQNPWSEPLFSNSKISQVVGDSYLLADTFGDAVFNGIIHDPPMFNLAGELYSLKIYRNFFRILKNNGRLFHYIGNPDSKMGATIGRGVVSRLKKAGFRVHAKSRAFGVLAVKQN